MATIRIVFMGTPELAATSLRALLACPGFEVAAVVTQPDRPSGRDLKVQASPVKNVAVGNGVPLLQPERARDPKFLESLSQYHPDLVVVAAFGQILPQAILDLPKHGCLNVHTSLLPKYRGAAPIQWAILNDEAETGVTIMRMDAGLDTGAMVTQEKTAISEEDDAQTLHDRLGRMGAELLVRTIPGYVSGKLEAHPQPADGATYARKIKKEDGRIDWTRSARAVWNRVRGLRPWPGAFTILGETSRPVLLKIWQASIASEGGEPGRILGADKNGIRVGCGEGSLRITTAQREGGRRLSAEQFLAGMPLTPGTLLGNV